MKLKTHTMNTTPDYRRALAAEPDLRAVEKVVHALADLNVMPGTVYDAIIKPLADPLIGRNRGTHHHAHNPEDLPSPSSIVRASDFPSPIASGSKPATDEEKWLRTREAFDAVTDVWLDYLGKRENPDRPYYWTK